MTQSPQWARIPYELQARPQWLLASADSKGDLKVPTSILQDGSLVSGSSTDRSLWLPFDVAYGAALHHKLGIGFVVSPEDPLVCIDLDVKGAHNEPDQAKWTPQSELDNYWILAQHADTYVELSQSGKGLHIWVTGDVMDGARHGGYEVYSRDRFLVCTGNILIDKPIANRQKLVDDLVSWIRHKQGASRKAVELVELDEVHTDEEIYRRASSADNAGKFNDLFAGRWTEGYDFPSQSEADLALLSMFTFYSRSDEQCRRLFRMSALGKRDKAQKDDRYLDYTLKLIRGRQAMEDERDARMGAAAEQMVANMLSKQEVAAYAASLGPANAAPSGAEDYTDAAEGTTAQGMPAAAAVQFAAPPAAVGLEHSLDWPPGLVGSLAGFIYRSAPRPVKEVAIVAALGWIAGVCGKMWNIPGSGLNLYIILVARSAIGKEAMHSGLGALTARLREGVPSAQEFVDFADFVSGPALVKACSNQSCFLNVAGEFGHKLRRMSEGRDVAMSSLRTVMTNLYQKSGPTSVVGGLTYSSKENNVASINGVAYSMIGETTPGTFYDSLTEDMMADGFLSRFTIVEYTGERPPMNKHQQQQPEKELAEYLMGLVVYSKQLLANRNSPIGVRRTDAAGEIMEAFDLECDTEINKTDDEMWRQMWNRASLKMMRISALLAVGDNFSQPVIDVQHVQWAMDLIRRDIKIMARRVESGDVGSGDGVRERKVILLIKEFFSKPVGLGYHIPTGMKEKGIIPRSYLQIRTARIAVFMNHRLGATKALDDTIRSIIDSGYLMEVDKAKMFDEFGSNGRAYRMLSLPDYSQHK